jgi:hypothetical protein
MRLLANWPKLVFVFVPVLIIGADAVVLVRDRVQAQAQKAIRLVQESNSRKENFTVQQYLYMTIYHRRDQGEAITIGGWGATSQPRGGAPLVVEFRYSDASGEHIAIWEASLKDGTVLSRNEAALDLSWH